MSTLHKKFFGRTGSVATPLEISSFPVDPSVSYWLLTSSGGNVDILNAFNYLAGREPKQLGVICATQNSPLFTIAGKHPYTDFFDFGCPTGKDGFLATNSLVATSLVLAKVYVEVFAGSAQISQLEDAIRSFFAKDVLFEKWRRESACLWSRDTTVVLHGMGTRPGAMDLESKFTEAALGVVQLADYRNFAHGRHHWLAKKGSDSCVVAFVAPEDKALADATLSCLPQDIPVVRFDFDGEYETSSISSLLAALYLSGWAGEAKGIDPGKPGVPPFGEKLYRLPEVMNVGVPVCKQRSLKEAAIERKSGQAIKELSASGNHDFWLLALNEFVEKLKSAKISVVVLDYDGTLVDTRDRYFPPANEISTELIRLLSAGILIGIATGRGPSVRRDLRQVIPEQFWPSVFIGYYNGAEVGLLDDEAVPDNSPCVCESLESLYCALNQQPELQHIARISPRRHQITVEPQGRIQEDRLWDVTNQLINSTGRNYVVVRSSHSVDILQQGVSKGNVLAFIRTRVGENVGILTIGDRGRWPGNDCVLLAEPLSLSVDEVSSDPHKCWNLSPAGQRGVSVTLRYLRSLVINPHGSGVCFHLEGDE
jgi:hydroxymethylpyrimidine pyrophosphatase-like HAD family hydrolase